MLESKLVCCYLLAEVVFLRHSTFESFYFLAVFEVLTFRIEVIELCLPKR